MKKFSQRRREECCGISRRDAEAQRSQSYGLSSFLLSLVIYDSSHIFLGIKDKITTTAPRPPRLCVSARVFSDFSNL